MTLIIEQSIAYKLPVILIDDTTFKDEETGVVYNATGMTVRYAKEATGGAHTWSTKTLSSGDWEELGHGEYLILFSTTELNTVGKFLYYCVADGILPYYGDAQIIAGETLSERLAHLQSNVDANVSTRSSHSAADVWTSGTRTLTAFTGTPRTDLIGADQSLTAQGYSTARAGYLDNINNSALASLQLNAANMVLTDLREVNDTAVTGPNDLKADVSNLDVAVSTRSSHSAADIWTSATRNLNSDANNTIRDAILSDATTFAGGNINATISSRSSHSAADIWTVGTRALTDKDDFTISGTIDTLDGLNNFDPTTDPVATVTSITNDVGITQAGADKVWSTATRSLTDKAGFTISGTITTLDGLENISTTEVNTEVDNAIETYRLHELMHTALGSQPVAGSIFADLTEDDGGTQRFNANALEQAPTGGTNPNVLVDTTISSVTSQTEFVLAAGSNDDNAYDDQAIVLYDVSDNDYPSVRVVTSYVGSTRTVTIDSAPDFTIVATDGVKIFVTAPGATAPTAAQVADAVWDEDIEGAHGGDTTAGLLLRVLGSAISDRSFNANLNALLGVTDSSGVDLPEMVWSEGTRALTDKAGFTISGTITTLDGLNNFNPTSDPVATVTSVTNDVGITQAGADKVWSTATRNLNSDANNTIRDAILSDATTFAGGNINATISSRAPANEYDTELDATISSRSSHTANNVRDAILSDSTPFNGANINATISSRAPASEYDTEMGRIDVTLSTRSSHSAADVWTTAGRELSTPNNYKADVTNLDVAVSTRAPSGEYDAELDATISSRSSHAAADIWTVGSRSLTDKVGFSLVADQSSVTIGTVNALGTQAKLDVNAEVDTALDTAIPGTPTAGSINAELELARKVLGNRWLISSNQLIVYDDDEATPLITFDLKDSGGSPTMTNVYERDPV